MSVFYRGAARGTHWHTTDPRRVGAFTARAVGHPPDIHSITAHVGQSRTLHSPFVSLTRSFGVAYDYACTTAPRPTTAAPAYVFEIVVPDPLPTGVTLIDPVAAIASHSPSPVTAPHHHEGQQLFLTEVAACFPLPRLLARLGLAGRPALQPAIVPGAPHASAGHVPVPSLALKSYALAIRDAEILALHTVPAAWIRNRFNVW